MWISREIAQKQAKIAVDNMVDIVYNSVDYYFIVVENTFYRGKNETC